MNNEEVTSNGSDSKYTTIPTGNYSILTIEGSIVKILGVFDSLYQAKHFQHRKTGDHDHVFVIPIYRKVRKTSYNTTKEIIENIIRMRVYEKNHGPQL
jgi:hypothetical protein